MLAYELLIGRMLRCADGDATSLPAGQAYFISDGTPIGNFEFLRPLCLARGKQYPTVVVSTTFMLGLALLLEQLFFVSRSLGYPIEPFLTRAEVLKVGVTHHFSIAKAARELGYKPLVTSHQGAERIARKYRANLSNEDYFDQPAANWWISIILGMGLLYTVAYSDTNGPLLTSLLIRPVNALALFLFRSQANLQTLFVSAVVVHVLEALNVVRVARNAGCSNTWPLWGLQTLILGYPSYQLLCARQALIDEARSSVSK